MRAAVRQHGGVDDRQHASAGALQLVHLALDVAARQHGEVGAQQGAVAITGAAELAHEIRQPAQRHVTRRHQRLRAPRCVLPQRRQRIGHPQLRHRGVHVGRRPHGSPVAAQRALEPDPFACVVGGAERLDALGAVAQLRPAGPPGHRFVLPGFGRSLQGYGDMAHRRCRVAPRHHHVAVGVGGIQAVELGRLLQQGPEQLGRLGLAFTADLQAG